MKLKDLGRTELGECYIYTKSKGRLYGEPLTRVVPTHFSELADFGVKIQWHTNDAAELRRLHRAVLKFLKEPGSAETFLEIKTILRARRRLPDKDRLENLAKAKSAQVFSESKSLESDEIKLVTSNLKSVT
jgi:hypothetical protein